MGLVGGASHQLERVGIARIQLQTDSGKYYTADRASTARTSSLTTHYFCLRQRRMIMSDLLSELSRQARTLPPEERAQLAEELLASLQGWQSTEIETAWDSEILRRLDEVERGVAILIPAEDVFAEARRITQ